MTVDEGVDDEEASLIPLESKLKSEVYKAGRRFGKLLALKQRRLNVLQIIR